VAGTMISMTLIVRFCSFFHEKLLLCSHGQHESCTDPDSFTCNYCVVRHWYPEVYGLCSPAPCGEQCVHARTRHLGTL
jgi:hypothetical protein